MLADEGTIVAVAQGNRDSDPSMENAVAAYLRARDQLLQGMDGLDSYAHAVHVLYVVFVQDVGIIDLRTLCEAFRAFRKALIHQDDAAQKPSVCSGS